MEFNDLTYGNPTHEQLGFIQGSCLVDDLFDTFKDAVVPNNDSELVKDELNEVADSLAVMSQPENQNYLKRYLAYDRNLIQAISSIFKQKDIEVEELVTEIVKDIQNLIFKLKFHIQRPRPFQIAQYYKLKLFPYKSFSAHTPSYPSGHTVQAIVILNVLGNKYPTEYQYCKELIEDISYSRVYLGHHYPSDNDGGRELGKAILKHPEFTKKYGI
jgi:hypothetical protein